MFGIFKKLVSPFKKKIQAIFSKGIDEASLEALEKLFYEADLGAENAFHLVEEVRKFAKKMADPTTDQILSFVQDKLIQSCLPYEPKLSHPHVILLVGVNGSGKTTSLAKLSAYYRHLGKSVLIAAGDTFRAAAIEQLESWAKKIGADFVKHKSGSDPSGVVYDAISAALARDSDIVLIDTAGRLQTKTDLMHELGKVRRVIQKQIPEAPHETLLVVDAGIGQNAIDQAKTFHEFTPLTGIILSKLDGSAKGGIAIAIQKELNIPICWIGTGEKETDFARFDPQSYVDALFQS